jgi:hypothetical protein
MTSVAAMNTPFLRGRRHDFITDESQQMRSQERQRQEEHDDGGAVGEDAASSAIRGDRD